MPYLLPLLVAFALTAAAAELGPPALFSPFAALFPALGIGFLGLLVRWAALSGRFPLARAASRGIDGLPLLGHGFAVFLCDLGQGGPAALGRWPGPGLLLALLPYLVFEWIAIAVRGRLEGEPRAWLRGYGVRMLAGACAPFALFVLFLLPLSARESWRIHFEEVSLLALGAAGLLLLLLALTLPLVLVRLWDTQPLAKGALRGYLEDVGRRAGLRCRDLLLWRTGGRVANAAVLGFLGPVRYVLFTDGILERLTPRELAAVLAHEAAHAVRKHVPLFAAFTVALLLGADLVVALADRLVPGGLSEGAVLWALGVALALWYGSFGWLSRRFELEADLCALRATGDGAGLISALEQVSGLHARGQRSWRHFSVAQRVLFLRAVLSDPAAGERLQRPLGHIRGGVAAACLLVVLGQGALLWGGLGRELAVVDLRLGRYGAALERLGRPDGGGDELWDLARVGWELGDRVTLEALGDAARRAEEVQDPARARLLRQLADLRRPAGQPSALPPEIPAARP